MEPAEMKRAWGVAQYEARWIARSLMVRLTARGILPCSNYVAQLEMRPGPTDPPEWNMVFIVSETCEKALVPFEAEAVMVNTTGATEITVHDGVGTHQVPIQPAFGAPVTIMKAGQAMDDNFVVFADIPDGTVGHSGCLVVPEGTIVVATKTRVFGPDSRDACDDFVEQNCSAEKVLVLRGGEIPWPLMA